VNDRKVATTRNLGLTQLELVPGCLYWIGTICINQPDIVERGKQVRLMTRMYSRAELVEVWLRRIEGSRYNWGADSSHEDRMSFDIGKRAPKILALDKHASNWASENSLDRSGKQKEHIPHQTDLLCLLTDYCRNDLTEMIEIKSTVYSALRLNTQEFSWRLTTTTLWKWSLQKLRGTWFRGLNV
jgi:hypothetical protein